VFGFHACAWIYANDGRSLGQKKDPKRMPREAPVTIAVFRLSATSIFLLSNSLVGSCHPEPWLQAFIDVTGGYLKRIAIAERTSAGA
jgi:hypothetical protein